MRKFVPFIALSLTAAVIFLAAIPDYKESKRPFNKLVTFAKAEGFALAVLLPESGMVKRAEQELAKLEELIKRSVPVRYFHGEEATGLGAEAGVTVPGYIIMDGDGNPAVRENDFINAGRISGYFQNIHTH